MTIPRRLLVAAATSAWVAPFAGFAQTPARPRRIGVLANASAQPHMPAPIEALREGLRALGHVEGSTLEIEYRWAEGKADRLPELAADLVRAKVELIVASGDAPTRAAKAATSSIPIVMATSGDAVGAGLVASLAHPGGNVTGMTAINPELSAKRLQLLRELKPKASRIGAIWNPEDASHGLDLQAMHAVAPQLGEVLLAFPMRNVGDVDQVFEQIARSKLDALVVLNDSTTIAARARLLSLAAQRRIPGMYEAREWAVDGGLLAFGVTHADLFRQSATHVDKILKGAKPADLPVEQPTKVRLTINMATAKALGLTIPRTLLLRADEVIE
jgi:putative ABC transport system substrate-binding protein